MTADEAANGGHFSADHRAQIDPDGVLLYLHIPKTAGTALADLLKGHYPLERCYQVKGPDYPGSVAALRALPPEAKASVDLVYGHFAFGLHHALHRPCHYYTIFRDPIDRVVSLYYFIRASDNHPRQQQVASMSLIEFALSGLHPEIENCQTKMLSGRSSTNFLTGQDPCDDTDLGRAMAHLDSNFIACGLFEDLPRSLYLLCKKMGWKYVGLERKNVTKGRRTVQDLSDEERDVLKGINQYDMRLYAHARQRHQHAFDDLRLIDRIRWHAFQRLPTRGAAEDDRNSSLS